MQRILFLLFVVLSLGSCQEFQDLEFGDIRSVEFVGISDKFIDMDIVVPIENRNNYKVILTQSELDLSMNGSPLGSLALKDKVEIPKHSVQDQTFRVRTKSDSFTELIKKEGLSLLFNPVVTLRAEGFIKGKALMVSKKFPIDVEQDVDVSQFF